MFISYFFVCYRWSLLLLPISSLTDALLVHPSNTFTVYFSVDDGSVRYNGIMNMHNTFNTEYADSGSERET